MRFLILSQEVAGKKKRIQTVSIACADWDEFVTTIADILAEPRTSGYVPVPTLETTEDGVKVMRIELQLTRHMANKLAQD